MHCINIASQGIHCTQRTQKGYKTFPGNTSTGHNVRVCIYSYAKRKWFGIYSKCFTNTTTTTTTKNNNRKKPIEKNELNVIKKLIGIFFSLCGAAAKAFPVKEGKETKKMKN